MMPAVALFDETFGAAGRHPSAETDGQLTFKTIRRPADPGGPGPGSG
jgi:hypothetical protein